MPITSPCGETEAPHRGPTMTSRRSTTILGLGLLALAALVAGMTQLVSVRMGRQPDGSFLVSSGQRIEGGSIDFTGRPIDLALHPQDEVFAVLNKSEVFLATARGVRAGTSVSLGAKVSAGFRGLIWSPDGTRLYASTDHGHIQTFNYVNGKLAPGARIAVQPAGAK